MADSEERTIGLDETEAIAEVDVSDKEKKPSSRVTVDMRYYYLHREERKKKQLERYHNDPAVIAKREEKARKRAEKGAMTAAEKAAQKEARRIEREKIIQERTAKALETRRKIKTKMDGGLTEFLGVASPSSSGLSDN